MVAVQRWGQVLSGWEAGTEAFLGWTCSLSYPGWWPYGCTVKLVTWTMGKLYPNPELLKKKKKKECTHRTLPYIV